MECPSCTFQNVPGLRECARCRSLLDLGQVDITPPRAGDHVIPLRFRSGVVILVGDAIDRLRSFRRSAASAINPDVDVPALLRTIVPGWGHRSVGLKRLGLCLTVGWIVLIVVAILLTGGLGGWPAYFALVGWHGLAVSLILGRPLTRCNILERAAVGVAVWTVLNLCIYLPAGWALHGLVHPFRVTGIINGPLLRNGDVVALTGRWNRPSQLQRGDVVVYVINGSNLTAAHAYIRPGFGIDRVLAVAGDQVTSDGVDIIVNGEPLPRELRPLRPAAFTPKFSLTVPEGTSIILASALAWAGHGEGYRGYIDDAAVNIAKVSNAAVVGKVMGRWRPFSRFGPLREDRDVPPARPATPATEGHP